MDLQISEYFNRNKKVASKNNKRYSSHRIIKVKFHLPHQSRGQRSDVANHPNFFHQVVLSSNGEGNLSSTHIPCSEVDGWQ